MNMVPPTINLLRRQIVIAAITVILSIAAMLIPLPVAAAHGFFVDGYGVDVHAEPGKSADVTFTADQPGKFKIRCSISCGVLHPFMIGELNVEPDTPLGRAIAALGMVTMGALVLFWKPASTHGA